MNSAASRNPDHHTPNEPQLPSLEDKFMERAFDDGLRKLDEQLADVLNERATSSGPAGILLVGGTPKDQTTFITWIEQRQHRCTPVETHDDAQAAIAHDRFDLVLLNPDLPDSKGLALVQFIHQTSPTTGVILFSNNPPVELLISALREGAIDLLQTPITKDEFSQRLDTALIKSRVDRQRNEHTTRLQRICRELNNARHDMAAQLDTLCRDMVTTYRDLTNQIEEEVLATEFRTILKQELDIEELLRTMLEYMLTKVGPTNAAVFLPDHDHHYELGAYVNYDCPRDSLGTLLDHLCQVICPQMEDTEQIISFSDAAEFAQCFNLDLDFLADSHVAAFSCLHEESCLAVVVLFRSQAHPFEDELAPLIDLMRNIFAEQLATVIQVHHRSRPSWPKEAEEHDEQGDEFGYGFGGLAA